jgi:hypothetical protein
MSEVKVDAQLMKSVDERLVGMQNGSSGCRTDDLLYAPRGPARQGIEARQRGPLRLSAREVDG